MRLLLINPPLFHPSAYSRYLEDEPVESAFAPIGLFSIGAVLEKDGHEIKIIDAYQYNWQQLERQIRDFCPQIVGITTLSDQRGSLFKLIYLVKAIDKNIKVILGGPHATLMYEQILTNFPVDGVIIGEGEDTMRELVNTWQNQGEIGKIKGIAYLHNQKVITTEERESISDLDSLPFPAFHFMDFNMYTGGYLLREIAEINGINYKDLRTGYLITSRGCPFRCEFCSVNKIWRSKWRARSASSIMKEIEWLYNDYNCNTFAFIDDIFSVDQKRVIELSKMLIEKKLNILFWGFQTGVKFVSEEMLKIAYEAGCRFIGFGIESGSTDVLKNVTQKIPSRDEMVNVLKFTKKIGITTGAFLMVGNPGENKQSINETIKLLQETRPDIIQLQIAMVFPGTGLYERAKKYNFMDDSFWLSDKLAPYYTCETDLKKLIQWHRKIKYYSDGNLKRTLQGIRDVIELHTGLKITKRGIKKVKIPV